MLLGRGHALAIGQSGAAQRDHVAVDQLMENAGGQHIRHPLGFQHPAHGECIVGQLRQAPSTASRQANGNEVPFRQVQGAAHMGHRGRLQERFRKHQGDPAGTPAGVIEQLRTGRIDLDFVGIDRRRVAAGHLARVRHHADAQQVPGHDAACRHRKVIAAGFEYHVPQGQPLMRHVRMPGRQDPMFETGAIDDVESQ
ncbi:hypothetical protein FQZ97_840770 [compost metagenome]